MLMAFAACGDRGDRCLDREFFRDRSDLYQVARVPGGYVVDAREGLIGYGDDDAERFRLDVGPYEFVGTDDGRLVTLALDGDALVLAQWSADGAALGELARAVVGPDLGHVSDVAISADGVALASGGMFEAWWWTRMEAGREPVVIRSDTVARTAVGWAPDGDAYVLESSWVDELGTHERVQLMRIGPDDAIRWSTTVYEPDPEVPLREQVIDLHVTAEGVYAVTFEGPRSVFLIRRYDPDGELVWTRVEARDISHEPGRPVVRDDGTSLWLDDVERSIRVRTFDAAGDVVHECTAPSDGNDLTDVEIDGDELFVVTVDRITRLRLGPPIGP